MAHNIDNIIGGMIIEFIFHAPLLWLISCPYSLISFFGYTITYVIVGFCIYALSSFSKKDLFAISTTLVGVCIAYLLNKRFLNPLF
jgi:uncharacterized membrane protein